MNLRDFRCILNSLVDRMEFDEAVRVLFQTVAKVLRPQADGLQKSQRQQQLRYDLRPDHRRVSVPPRNAHQQQLIDFIDHNLNINLLDKFVAADQLWRNPE
jgi:hypothetical protein